jgi:hypothetical protein
MRMLRHTLNFLLFFLGFTQGGFTQDTLVFFNTKTKELKSDVVHRDGKYIYLQSDKKLKRMQEDDAYVVWGKGKWRKYGKRKSHRKISSVKKSDGTIIQIHVFDTLLLIKRTKFLKSQVVHQDKKYLYVQSDKKLQRMQKDGVSVVWGKGKPRKNGKDKRRKYGKGKWSKYGKRKSHYNVRSVKKSDGTIIPIHEFDEILLTNGRVKSLMGSVVDYDHNDIFYQHDFDRIKMELAISKKETRRDKIKTTKKWEQKQEKQSERLLKNEEKQIAKLEKLRKGFEANVKYKLATLSSADFEKWKTKELDVIKSVEMERELASRLKIEVESIKQENSEARFRRKFTSTVNRAKVFSILRTNEAEEVVYNADTLGYFADGEAELEYGVEEMRMYVKGRQDGRKHSLHDLGIGFGVGLASSLVMTWTLDAFYGPIPPAISLIVLTVLPTKVNPKLKLSGGELQSQAYLDGYERSATARKAWAFSVGSIAGLSIGTAAALLTAPLLR